MRYSFFLILLFRISTSFSQELYINSEPASLIPKGTKVVRLYHSNIFLDGSNYMGSISNAYLFTPSIAYGLSKKLMVSGSFQFSNKSYEQDTVPNLGFNGFKLYSKLRILTTDKQKYHTRLSSFIKYSYHENKFMKDNLDLDLQDTGLEFGLIGTQLINKLAVSITSGFGRINFMNNDELSISTIKNSFSAGYLLFPRKYNSYKQTNFNLYLEYLTSVILSKNYPARFNEFSSTLAPGIQFIFLSRSRLDLSYKLRKGDMPDELLIKLTYIIY